MAIPSLELLLVEDNTTEGDNFNATIRRLNTENDTKHVLIVKTNYSEALAELDTDKNYDGLIVDLNLGSGNKSGSDLLTELQILNYIIPSVILSGTPDIKDSPLIRVFTKGDDKVQSNIIDYFVTCKQLGLSDLLGGKGLIQNALKAYFYNNYPKQEEYWMSEKHKPDVQHAILRNTLSHLLEALGVNSEKYLLGEMYIYPPNSEKIKTGSIIKMKNKEPNTPEAGSSFYIVLTPACDLAHEGKAENILLAEIILWDKFIKKYIMKDNATALSRDQKKTLHNYRSNKGKNSFHFLPRVYVDFPGGWVDFSSVQSYSPSELSTNFDTPIVQIAHEFIKDILSRFSSFYARQGQPDLDHDGHFETSFR